MPVKTLISIAMESTSLYIATFSCDEAIMTVI